MDFEPITFEEYEAAYRRFIACLQETGVEHTEAGLDPEHQRFVYFVQGDLDPVTHRVPGDDCYDREFADADERWQYQQQAPLMKATFDRALAFFADRGVTEFPEGYVESESLGGLIQHAVSIHGEQVARDYSQAEQAHDVRQRMEQLETQPAPAPWEELATVQNGSFLAVGLSDDSRFCLVVGHHGRSVVDVTTGEEVARVESHDLDSFLSRSNTVAAGIGPLDGVNMPLAGLWGGGLPSSTPDGWYVFRMPKQWSDERIVLQCPDANMYSSYKGLTQIAAPLSELRAVGFTLDGAVLVVATSSTLQIWRRPMPNETTGNKTSTDSVRS